MGYVIIGLTIIVIILILIIVFLQKKIVANQTEIITKNKLIEHYEEKLNSVLDNIKFTTDKVDSIIENRKTEQNEELKELDDKVNDKLKESGFTERKKFKVIK